MSFNSPVSFSVFLNDEFQSRSERNSKFSLRSFARFLDIPVSTLSALLSGTTNPTATTLRKIGKKLEWKPELITDLEHLTKKAKHAKTNHLNARRAIEPREDLLKSQTPLALFAIAKTGVLKADSTILALALGITKVEVEAELKLLLHLKIVYIEEGILKAVQPVTAIIEDPDGPLLKRYIANWLERGATQILTAAPFESNSILFNIVAPKDRLEALRSKFEAFARSIRKSFPLEGATGELYCVGAVVFPFKEKRKRID